MILILARERENSTPKLSSCHLRQAVPRPLLCQHVLNNNTNTNINNNTNSNTNKAAKATPLPTCAQKNTINT